MVKAARTFLFTDLEGSTSQWMQDETLMAAALRDHDATLRAAVEEHHGKLLKHTGDGILAVFDDPLAAVNAASAAQRALRADGRVRARMGLHLGPAEERDGDYFGPTLNRAARIMAAAHGNQVLASVSVASAVTGSAETVDLGPHRLKDLLEPEHLFQIVVEDESAYPPVRSIDAYDENLPRQRTRLIGREEDAERVRALFGSARLVTLTGAGGIGKTRLAIEVAARALDDHDGALFLDLAPIADPALVVPALANAMGVQDRDGEQLDACLRVLRTRAMVVVVDNCEHLLDASADLVEAILDHTAKTLILATSREPLGVDAEQVWRVPSLPPATAAADLFIDRATAAAGTFVVDDVAARAIQHICERLDGIPLAIELAAARVTHLSVTEIADRLSERFRLLTGGRRRAQQRHQTLQAALDWSHDLLSADERVALRRSGVFVGGFTLDALDRITGSDLSASALDVLASLVDKSLVVARPDTAGRQRYALLETVRLYAIDRMVEAGELEELRTRHAEWLTEWVEQWLLEDGGLPLWSLQGDRPAEEMDNILAALEWADERGDLRQIGRIAAVAASALGYGGYAEESARYLSRDDVEACLTGVELARYVMGSGVIANAVGDFLRQAEMGDRARSVTTEAGVRRSAEFLMANGLSISDPVRSTEMYDELLVGGESATPAERAWALYRSSDPLFMTGRIEEGTARVDAAFGLTEDVDFGFDYGFPHLLLGHLDTVRKALSQAETRYTVFLYRNPLLAGFLAALEGRFDSARTEFDRAAGLVERYPLPLADREVVTGYAALAHHQGDQSHAAFLLGVAGQPPAFSRSPALYAVHMHYRRLVRPHFAKEAIQEIRAAAARRQPRDVMLGERHGAEFA